MCVALGWLHLEREQKVHLKTILYLLCVSLHCCHLSASAAIVFCIEIERWILHCVSELHCTGQRERGSFEDNGVKLIGAIHFHTSFLFVKILMVMMIVIMIVMMVVMILMMMIKLIYVKHFPQSASCLEGCLLYGGVAKTLC